MLQSAATLDAYRTVALSRAKELPTRIGLSLLGAAVLYLGGMPVFALVYALLALSSQLLDRWVFSRFFSSARTRPVSNREKLAANLSMFQATAIYSLVSVGLWNSWGATGEAVALLFLCGALFHIAVHSNQDMVLTLSGGLPHAAYLISLPVLAMFGTDGPHMEYGLVLIAGLLFLMHFIVAARRFGDASLRIRDAQHKAELANAAKTRFLSNMSHEIRTPLNGVMGMAQLLEHTDLTSKQRDYLRTLNSSGYALRGLIDDVLDISRIEAGELVLESVPYTPADLLRAAADTISSQTTQKGLALELDIAPDLEALAMGDATRTLQILTNFAGNAVKFTEIGAIAISGRMIEPGRMELSVSDTGPGIAPDALTRIFERFHQLDDSPRRRYEGTGLGLTIAQEIANLAGGEIGVESELGSGSRFWVRLPHTIAKPGAVRALEESANQTRELEEPVALARTALVVENNTINRKLLTEYLEGAGWSVFQAVNAEHALEILDLSAQDPDVILLDLHMPGLSGEELLSMLRNAYPESPVIIVTADATSGTSQRLREKGASGYFAKPINLNELGETLDQITLCSANTGQT